MNEKIMQNKSTGRLWPYALIGIYFGIVLTKGEVISWFRIQEMFRFQSFHLYGVIGAAVAVAALSIWLIKRRNAPALDGSPVAIPSKRLGTGTRYWAGGTIFGLGWALTGACPGPLFILVGNGVTVMLIAIVAAVAGTWTYGALRPRLPH
ncbi:MAG: YeeE/YedE family protein [Bacteroidetes bacterium]|nr:YeeE/YedE family protein [Bacteroidota bacterium]